ncbi:FAD-dependent urate hydroxylase [Blastocladiella emersonii ATCC 22665]|nr:FAD-dependent urate hydroxylase [Blastocladiella emersonii ATCC 22665]
MASPPPPPPPPPRSAFAVRNPLVVSPLVPRGLGAFGAEGPDDRLPGPDGKCPPCFNCLLPAFQCHNFGTCSSYTGRCECPAGFGGDDCAEPLCGSLVDANPRRPPRRDAKQCACTDGWTGLNCNVCARDDVCNALVPPGLNGTCYASPIAVKANHQMCKVTNPKIVEMLKDDKPEVTLSCNATAGSAPAPGAVPGPDGALPPSARCGFQFWIGGVQSFYCDLDQCTGSVSNADNSTAYDCDKIRCGCLADRMLCGKDGSVDIREFLAEEVRGPGKLTCTPPGAPGGRKCEFTEPAMDNLISDIFGDTSIQLQCSQGECLHVSQIPGYGHPGIARPPAGSPLVFALLTAGALLVVACVLFAFWRVQRRARAGGNGTSYLPMTQEELDKLMADHVPATLAFRDIRYRIPIPGKRGNGSGGNAGGAATAEILHGIHGVVRHGEIMAIMGGSGAGKSSCLDILARRNKSGVVSGHMLVNGRVLDRSEFKQMCGFVDQEDMLMPTLTVEETILYSALLRLPKDMSYEAKWNRVRETMVELGITHIAKSRIGDASMRGISGGEKRRVSIACELVTSPSILFLDEATSGLDAFNAANVVECLRNLARNYNRTIVLTIHQPRSDIFAMFDRLLLLSKGHLVYSGAAQDAVHHFTQIGYQCPVGYNIADYLIDITVGNKSNGAGGAAVVVDPEAASAASSSNHSGSPINVRVDRVGPAPAANGGATAPLRAMAEPSLPPVEGDDGDDLDYWENNLPLNASGKLRSSNPRIDQIESTPLRPATPLSPHTRARSAEARHLQHLAEGFGRSSAGATLQSELREASRPPAHHHRSIGHSNGPAPENDVDDEREQLLSPTTQHIRSLASQRAPLLTQFRILADRTFKNLYRNPYLLLTHYLMAVVVAVLCGLLFWRVTADIAGFQNRMGCFFFVCSLFGFSCLSSLQTFAAERVLFTRERANGYYSPLTYFLAKILCDMIPLRVVPPLLLGCIIYNMVGLVASYVVFLKFLLVLVLFNVTAAALCFLASLAVPDTSVANLFASLAMLFSMLFGKVLLNTDTIPGALRWLQHLSFFNYALEALVVNELKELQLTETKYGLQIEVPAAVILSTFGFNAQAFWADVYKLVAMSSGFLVLAYLTLHFFVKERR